MSINKLIHRITHDGYPGGLTQLAIDMNINYNTLKSKANHTIATHYFSGEELALLADLINTDEIAGYFADRRGLMCIRKPDFNGLSDSAILELFLKLQKEQGDWAKEISKAMENGSIDKEELGRIRKEYTEFVVAAAEIMNRLETFMEASEQHRARRPTSIKGK